MDHNANERAIFRVAQRAYHLRHRALTIDEHAAADSIQRLCGRMPIQQRLVLLLHAKARMRDAEGDLAIIREQQQPFGRTIQAANRYNAFSDLHEVHHRVAATLVVRGGDVAARLVEHDVAAAFLRDEIPVNFHLLRRSIDAGAEFGHHFSVNANASFNNQFFGFPATGNASSSKHALQPFHVYVLF